MIGKRAVLALKVVLWVAALAPGAWLLAGWTQQTLGANPTEKITHVTGMTTLVLLLVTLSVSPIRRLTGWNRVIQLRRPLGLFAFSYASVHFLVWLALYNVWSLDYIVEDIAERPFVTVGFTAWLILVPLAVTSTRGWIRRLGRRWTTLHRGIYVAATLGVVHFYWLVKADTRLPLLLGGCLAILLAFRVGRWIEGRVKRRERAQADAAQPPVLSGSSSRGRY